LGRTPRTVARGNFFVMVNHHKVCARTAREAER
jgi:hypothetical protein